MLRQCRINSSNTAILGDGARYPKQPGIFARLELHHRTPTTTKDGRCIDSVQHLAERRQSGERPSSRRGSNSSCVLVVTIVIGSTHHNAPFWKASSAAEKDRTSSLRPGT